ncbi:MAG: hypothetical protein IJX78_05670 [Bacilli bacterium]|nr:hypothetical protein [Bacilli bacterium]
MKKNINAEKHWNRFLQTGKIDDFLKYRQELGFVETKTDVEIGKIKESKEVSHAEESSVYRYRSKKS